MSSLRNIREKKGFNISQLASRSGIASKTLLEYEEGRVVMTLAHARLLAKALWVEVDELMTSPGSAPQPVPPSSSAPAQDARPMQQRSVQPVQSSVSSSVSTAQPQPAVSPQPLAQTAAHTAQQPRPPANNAQQNGPSSRTETRAPRAPKIIPPVSEGQVQELLQLAQRLDISQEQLEERVGKPLSTLNRPDATEWVKRLRAIADEIAPASKVKYGRWPDSNEDREAAYLSQQRNASTKCTFHLFNGEEFSGVVRDYTPYTITIKVTDSDEEMVLRKLAIAYYRCVPAAELEGSAANVAESQPSVEQAEPQHDHARDDHHQPLDKGVDSDRVGQPETPQRDKMDEDRGI